MICTLLLIAVLSAADSQAVSSSSDRFETFNARTPAVSGTNAYTNNPAREVIIRVREDQIDLCPSDTAQPKMSHQLLGSGTHVWPSPWHGFFSKQGSVYEDGSGPQDEGWFLLLLFLSVMGMVIIIVVIMELRCRWCRKRNNTTINVVTDPPPPPSKENPDA